MARKPQVGDSGYDMQAQSSHDPFEHPPGIMVESPPNHRGEATETSETTKKGKTVEEKRLDFSRLASRRVSNVIDAMASLRHLCSTASYDWSQEQQEAIFTRLRQGLNELENMFNDARNQKETGKKTTRSLSFQV